jgi:hypothetical protein
MFGKKSTGFKKIKSAKRHKHNTISTMDLIKRYLDAKIPARLQKQSVVDQNISLLNKSAGAINHIAVVLDGRVEEVVRAQNRMTALLLSNPTFIEFDPTDVYPIIGVTEYADGKFTETLADQKQESSEDAQEVLDDTQN